MRHSLTLAYNKSLYDIPQIDEFKIIKRKSNLRVNELKGMMAAVRLQCKNTQGKTE